MAPLRGATLLASLATIIRTSTAYGFGGYGAPFGSVYVLDANSTGWLELVDNSNTTGLFSLPGYDVSQPWPGKAIDGWTLSVAAVDTNELLDDPEYRTFEIFEDRLVGYSMNLVAPDSLMKTNTDGTKFVNVDASWGMCLWNWESPGYGNSSLYNNPENKTLSADGSCTGFLSDACIAAIEKAATTSYALWDDPVGPYNSRLDCQDIETPAECGDSVGGSPTGLVASTGVPIQYLNGSVTFTDGYDVPQSQNTSAQDLEDMWDSFVVNFWPVMTLFVNMTNGSSFEDVEPGLAKINCIAPDGVGTGKVFTYSSSIHNSMTTNSTAAGGGNTTAGGGDGKNAADMDHAPLRWVIFGALMLSILLQV